MARRARKAWFLRVLRFRIPCIRRSRDRHRDAFWGLLVKKIVLSSGEQRAG